MPIVETKYNIYPYRTECNHVIQYKVSTLSEANRIISTIAKSDNYKILNINIADDEIPTSNFKNVTLSLSSFDHEPIDPIALEKGWKI